MTIKKVLAITACPVGIAHTYIAQDKLEQAATKQGYKIKVETHGSIGIKNEITAEDVADADLIIIATAAGVPNLRLERFTNKPLYQVGITQLIKNPDNVMTEAFAQAKPYQPAITTKNDKKEDASDIFSTTKKGVMKHVMSGVGYMVPFIVFGGIMIAISAGLSQAIYGPGKTAPYPSFLWFMNQAGTIGFQLMIPILAGFIANSIAGRAALAPSMIVAFLANATVLVNGQNVALFYPISGIGTVVPAGFLGALLIGPGVGYTVKWITTWKVPKILAPVMPIFFIPILVTFVFTFMFVYAVGAPLGWVMGQFESAIKAMPPGAMAAVGFLLGAMVGFDMGGPINKIAFLAASGLIGTNPTFMGAVATAIPVAPIGMGLTTLIFRKHFNTSERSLGITAIFLGCIGISEGAIPFAVRDPKRAIISNIVGSAIAGSIAGAFFITDLAAHGGPIVGILGAIGSTSHSKVVSLIVFFSAIIIGSLATASIYGSLLTLEAKNFNLFKKNNKLFNKNKTSETLELMPTTKKNNQ